MGHSHRSDGSALRASAGIDGLLVAGAVVLIALRSSLSPHPVLFGVLAALLVGLTVHRVSVWVEKAQVASWS